MGRLRASLASWPEGDVERLTGLLDRFVTDFLSVTRD
jgi:hypothetical protein